ncbi:hypothetical protein [Achromobacter phage Motura]|uniref:Uncharacterized protein n=1 Tax=Achromobacter phage Motura TaxID=2591403 RepID=A0A514CSL2_9CAUD|nr:hypothetical protein H1O15_gp337 [Achromobacter phage Motura]QDH83469.1 hypothetical protein [Achromobacter phage Motura]
MKKAKKDPGALLKKKKKAAAEVETTTKKKKVDGKADKAVKIKKSVDDAKKLKKAEKVTKGNPEGKKSKADKGLTPLQKAQLAKKNGTAKPKAKRKPLPTWKAPSDLKRYAFEIRFTTEKDGMPGSTIKVTRYQGKIEADKDPRKMWDLATYDPQTVIGIAARLSLTLFHATGKPSSKGVPSRLQGKTEYILHGAVGPTKEGKIKAAIAKVFVEQANKKGKVVLVELDKKDYQTKKIRKVNKYFAGAFANVIAEAPKHERKRRKEADDE